MKPYYQEGKITIYHGDCREVLPELDYVGMLITDPPYGTGGIKGYGRMQNYNGDKGREIAGDKNLETLATAMPLIYLAIGEPGWCTTFSSATRLIETGNLFCASGFEFEGELIWDKRTPGLGYTIRYSHETILVFRKGNPERNVATINSLFSKAVDRQNISNGHPHEKPIALLKSIMLLGGGKVLDPFCGSGTTLRAAKDLGREAIGIEIEEKYCEMSVKLLKQEALAWELK